MLHRHLLRAALVAAPLAASLAAAFLPTLAISAPLQKPTGINCPHNPNAMGSARTIEVDTRGGPDIGTMQYARTVPVGPKELVLTFDDGPNPDHTPKILDALDRHCIKATFFMVGRYAKLHPEIVKDVWRRGHTVASHTWSHPILSRMSYYNSVRQIDRGTQAIEAALAGATDANGIKAEVAPFFRFPGLNHTKRLRTYLSKKNVAIFSCDIGTDDWRRISPRTLYKRALRMIASKGSGVVIFHDTHYRTSYMLPQILDELARRGYTTVHMVPKGDARHMAAQARAAEVHAELAIEPTMPMPPAQAFPGTSTTPESVAEASHSLRPTVAN
ncbi:polysaccharide deacetylase family protein [Pyruvatibacter sp.]